MRTNRGILIATGLLLMLVGAAGLLAPGPFHHGSGIEVGTDAGLLSELRGAYGALLAIGAVVAAGAFVRRLTAAAALTGAALYLGYGLARLLSLAADGLVAGVRARDGDSDRALPELTSRERDILKSIASGDTVRQTARTLGIAQKTVENIQARLFRKLGVHNRSGAIASAHSLGLMGDDDETLSAG